MGRRDGGSWLRCLPHGSGPDSGLVRAHVVCCLPRARVVSLLCFRHRTEAHVRGPTRSGESLRKWKCCCKVYGHCTGDRRRVIVYSVSTVEILLHPSSGADEDVDCDPP